MQTIKHQQADKNNKKLKNSAKNSVQGSYAVGSWKILRDHVAMVHAGEMIIPANISNFIRNILANPMPKMASAFTASALAFSPVMPALAMPNLPSVQPVKQYTLNQVQKHKKSTVKEGDVHIHLTQHFHLTGSSDTKEEIKKTTTITKQELKKLLREIKHDNERGGYN